MAGQSWVCARRGRDPGLWRPEGHSCPRFTLLMPALYSPLVYLRGCNRKKIPVAHDVTGLLPRVKLNKCQSRSSLMMLGGA
jgi:hypothetical protein